MMLDFEIIPFDLLPPWIRWWTADYNNKEYGSVIYETVDDLDADGDFLFCYGVIWSDGEVGVYEDYEQALWDIEERLDG